MHEMNELDLNLLRTLDVLLHERSVTTAAKILGRSQPAVSHGLARLRETLGDPLLVRQGRALVPTPRALALQGPLRHLLRELQRTLEHGTTFDPAHSERTFRMACPDMLAPLLPDLLAGLVDAPSVQLELLPRSASGTEDADLTVDVLPEHAPGIVARRIGLVDQSVIARADHPALLQPWGLDAWLAWPHVLVRTREGLPSLVERALAAVGRERRVGLVLPELLLVPHVVARTDLFFTGPQQVFRVLAPGLGLAILPTPIPLPSVPVAVMWQERHAADPGHRWFRERVATVLERLLQRDPPGLRTT